MRAGRLGADAKSSPTAVRPKGRTAGDDQRLSAGRRGDDFASAPRPTGECAGRIPARPTGECAGRIPARPSGKTLARRGGRVRLSARSSRWAGRRGDDFDSAAKRSRGEVA